MPCRVVLFYCRPKAHRTLAMIQLVMACGDGSKCNTLHLRQEARYWESTASWMGGLDGSRMTLDAQRGKTLYQCQAGICQAKLAESGTWWTLHPASAATDVACCGPQFVKTALGGEGNGQHMVLYSQSRSCSVDAAMK